MSEDGFCFHHFYTVDGKTGVVNMLKGDSLPKGSKLDTKVSTREVWTRDMKERGVLKIHRASTPCPNDWAIDMDLRRAASGGSELEKLRGLFSTMYETILADHRRCLHEVLLPGISPENRLTIASCGDGTFFIPGPSEEEFFKRYFVRGVFVFENEKDAKTVLQVLMDLCKTFSAGLPLQVVLDKKRNLILDGEVIAQWSQPPPPPPEEGGA